MNRNSLIGLSPLWLMSLAMALGTLLLILVPVIISGESIKPSDWIGFSGNIAAGFMTLIAATVAWISVQKQIEIQRTISNQQTAIQKFNILQDQLSIMQEEDRLVDAIDLQAKYVQLIKNTYFSTPLIATWQVARAKEYSLERIDEMVRADEAFQLAGRNRWTLPHGINQRNTCRAAFVGLRGKVTKFKGELSLMELRSPQHVSASDSAWITAFDLSTSQQEVEVACGTYQASIRAEIQRLNAIVQAMRADAGL